MAKVRSGNSVKKHTPREGNIPWRYLFLLMVFPAIGVANLAVNYQAPWGILVYVVASFLTYCFYWDDKRRAQRNEWRIPEANLHWWSLLGGWPGAFVAQQQFRHKTKKRSFLLVFWLTVILHQVFWFDWLVMESKGLYSIVRFAS